MKNTEEKEEYLQGIIFQHEATIKQMEEVHNNDEAEKLNLQNQLDLKCRECDQLKLDLSTERNINKVHQEYKDVFLKRGPFLTMNVTGNVDVSHDIPGVEIVKTPAEASKTKATDTIFTPQHETFFDRVKAIIRLTASKNGQVIKCRAKGHTTFYTYYINAECLCKALDEMVDKEIDRFIEFLGGNIYNVQLSKVCYFIGHVLRMNVINDTTLPMNDILFAFEPYYSKKTSLHSKLCDKTTTPAMNVFMGIFEGLLRRFQP